MQLFRLGAMLSASLAVATGCGGFVPDDSAPLGMDVSALSTWSVRELGPGWAPSLAMDAKGFPVVSVAQGVPDPTHDGGDVTPVLFTNDGSWRVGGGWRSEFIGHLPGYREGNENSVAVMGTTPQLVFNSRENGRHNLIHLKMATWGPGGWQVETLNDEGMVYQAVQRVFEDTTWVVYQDPVSSYTGFRVASNVSGSWQTHSLSIPTGLWTSVDFAIGHSRQAGPVLGVATTSVDEHNGLQGLHFATSFDGGETWEPSVHVDDTWGMIGPQLAYSGLTPMITYTELDAKKAKFAYSKDGGATWEVETIGTFDVNPATGLAIDPRTGEPVVAITVKDLDAFEDRLYVARRDGDGNWTFEIVDRVDLRLNYRYAVNPRIAINDKGEIAIAWERYQDRDRRVRFAWDASSGSVRP